MVEYAQFALIAGTLLVALALAADVAVVTLKPAPARRAAPAYAGVGGRTETLPAPEAIPATGHGLAWYGTQLARLALVFLTASLVLRSLATGHGPFANQHEFAVSFAWGMLAAYLYFEWRYRVRTLALLMLPITAAMLCYATTVDAEVEPLVPALQHNLLLTLHVATAVLAYGAAAVAFAAAVLFLAHPRIRWRGMPRAALLDEIGYRAAVLAYPLMTIMIILGAIWADIAWGSYWSWDPKETAALLTWLMYGAYLHARVVRDWRGRRAAWLLILGFVAVLFTYFGNLFFGGLHSYA